MDKITVKDLEVFANHGVYEQENFLGQKFVISAVLHTDTRMAGLTDNLENSIKLWGSFPFDKKSRRGKYLELN